MSLFQGDGAGGPPPAFSSAFPPADIADPSGGDRAFSSPRRAGEEASSSCNRESVSRAISDVSDSSAELLRQREELLQLRDAWRKANLVMIGEHAEELL